MEQPSGNGGEESTGRTRPLLPSHASSPLLHLSASSADGSAERGRQSNLSLRGETAAQSHERPRLSDHGEVHSFPALSSGTALPLVETDSPQRKPGGRALSAGATPRAKSQMSSPDRYISQRTPTSVKIASLRVGQAPSTLTPRERYTRCREDHVSPFRPHTSSSTNITSGVRGSPRLRNAHVPRYIPSFVHRNTTGSQEADPNLIQQTLRQVSTGAVWNVGGRLAVQGGQIHGVSDGFGGLTASNTNAPLHSAHFLDRETSDDQIRSNENRLALALDIDRVNRILTSSSPHATRQTSPFMRFLSLGQRDILWHGTGGRGSES